VSKAICDKVDALHPGQAAAHLATGARQTMPGAIHALRRLPELDRPRQRLSLVWSGTTLEAQQGASAIRAIWNGAVLAEAPSHSIRYLDGNAYFPPPTLNMQYLRSSEAVAACGWKGVADYYDVVVEGQVNVGAAWYYATPVEAASDIAGYVTFWRGVTISASSHP
jgi:uncharacterized protein (DUF427 family)